MDLIAATVDHLGLIVFTALSIAVIGYLLYAMINPTRF